MSTLKDRLVADMKVAMKSGEKERLGVIRLILAAIKQREVDERIQMDDTQVTFVLDKMLKQRRESISQYHAARRDDLANLERVEARIIQEYLPEALGETEIDVMIQEAIVETGATDVSGMGKVIAVLKPKMQGRADMSMVSGRVKSLLGV